MRLRQFLLITLAAGLVLGVAACSDDDDPVAAVVTPYFSIEIDVDDGPRKAPSLDCDFAMGMTGVLPEVSFNGHEVQAFGGEGSILWASLEIPYSDTVEWEVRRGDAVVSGTIAVPEGPGAVTCNGTTLSEGSTVEVPMTDTYVFAWTGATAEFFTGNLEIYDDGYVYHNWSVSEPTVSYTFATSVEPRYFRLRAVNGAQLVPGAGPNASGWAKGYVNAASDSRYYYLDGATSRAALPVEAPLHQRLAAFLD
jgi:hypothetical protein